MKRLSPAEIAQERRWRIKAWVLTTLAPDTIAAVLARSMPPTISELHTLARKRAEECAGKCPSCGEPLPVAGPQARPPKRRSKPLTATKEHEVKTDSRAALEATKLKRIEAITAVDEATIHASCDAADLEVCRAHVLTFERGRSNAVAACRVDDVITLDTELLRARITVEIAASKAAASTAIHANAVTELRQAEAAISDTAQAVLDDELIGLAGEFVQALDAAFALGEHLRVLSGSDAFHRPLNVAPVALPAEVTRALARLPLRDQLRVPVDVLRGAGEVSALRAKRLAELRAA